MEASGVSGVAQNIQQQSTAKVYDAQQAKARKDNEAESTRLKSVQTSQANEAENRNPPPKASSSEPLGQNVDTFA